ncbi:MAG: response regulator transcription factor [Chloroflexi bacterium]|nr:response regulator transcription factor [Chloroflexota bacterium]
MIPTRILLADDHALVRAGIGNALKNQPHLQIVGEVGDGPGLLQALDTLRPDLLLIDVTMPNFEPITTMQHVHAKYPNLFILVVSAHDDTFYVQGLLRVGVNGYHLKDQPLSDLQLAIDQILSGKRWISSPLVDKLLKPTEGKTVNIPKLSPRQLDILHLLTKGLDNRGIAAQLGLSIKTIETHLTRLYRQLRVHSRLEATNYVHEHPEIIAPVTEVAPPQPVIMPTTKQSTILVVDDNQRYRQQLRKMVSRVYQQAVIYEAGNINDAIYVARQRSPQIAFVDVVLGDEDGIRCTRQIKMETSQTRVILMSAYPDREFHRMGLEAGAIAFIDKKDLDAATLFQIITDVVG